MTLNTAQKRTTSTRDTSEASLDKKIMGVPARIMAPRLLFIAMVCALVCFGFVMIYSASSVKAISDTGDAAYFLKRQLICAALGLCMALVIALVDYHFWCDIMPALWAVSLGMLVLVWLFGEDTNGASRWIEIGFIRLQPSEFAKISIVLAAATIANRYYGEHAISPGELIVQLAVFVVVPMGLILIQPDKGTTGVIVVMLLAVALNAGFPVNTLIKFVGFFGAIALVIVLADGYSRQRVLTMLNPWLDPYDTGWQLSQGFIAFGSGGLFGVGLGMSRQKYSYLPEAHNDFIFAIIGEELGLLGTLAVLLAFAVLLYEAIQIMRQSSDLLGKLIVCGSITILITQAFLNITGVLGLFPLSGKPLPFLSYGGSSIMSSLMLAGLVVNVSLNSSLPETTHDVRRRDLKLAGDEDTGVGNARSRSASVQESSFRAAARTGSVQLGGTRSGGNRSGGTRDGGLSVIEGGINERERAKDRSQASRQGHGRSRSDNTSAAGSFTESRGSNGYTRLDKHEDASTRLRSGSNSPKVRGGTTNTGSAKGTRHNKRS